MGATKTGACDYEIQRLSGSTTPITIQGVGQKTFNGGTWDDFQVTCTVADGSTVNVFAELLDPDSVTIAGYRFTYPAGATDTDYTVTLDTPVSLDTQEMPVGVQQQMTLNGTLELADGTPPITAQVAARYTKTTSDATVESRFGTVSGVQVFEGDASLEEGHGWDLLDIFKGQTVKGTVWYHSAFGVLKIEVDDWPLGAALTGEHDCGNPSASDYNTIQKVGMVSPCTAPGSLDTKFS